MNNIEKDSLSTLVNILPHQTKRLKLVNIDQKYAHQIFSQFTSEVAEFMYPQPFEDIGQVVQMLSNLYQENMEWENFHIIILDQEDNFVWMAGLHSPHTSTPEFWIWLTQKAQWHWYWKEVVLALKQIADDYIDYEYLIYPVDESNTSSQKLALQMGWVLYRQYTEDNANKTRKLNLLEYRIYSNKYL